MGFWDNKTPIRNYPLNYSLCTKYETLKNATAFKYLAVCIYIIKWPEIYGNHGKVEPKSENHRKGDPKSSQRLQNKASNFERTSSYPDIRSSQTLSFKRELEAQVNLYRSPDINRLQMSAWWNVHLWWLSWIHFFHVVLR